MGWSGEGGEEEEGSGETIMCAVSGRYRWEDGPGRGQETHSGQVKSFLSIDEGAIVETNSMM